MSLDKHKIAFIGSGNMSKAIISGLISNGFVSSNIWISGRNTAKLNEFKDFNVHTTQDNIEAIGEADIVVLAVKPKQMKVLCEEIKAVITEKNPLVISVAAGLTIAQLQNDLTADLAILRAMPNTPCALGAGVIGLVANPNVKNAQREAAESIFRATGVTFWLEHDNDLNLVTALAGAGPAYVFLFMESLQQAAIDAGLKEKDAELMTKQMVLGAARMALETNESMVQLRQDVTSKGGTTEAAINSFIDAKFGLTIADAFNHAVTRAETIEAQLLDLDKDKEK